MPGTLVLYCCCFPCSGSALVTAEGLERVCVTCQKQYKIAEILCFSLYNNLASVEEKGEVQKLP